MLVVRNGDRQHIAPNGRGCVLILDPYATRLILIELAAARWIDRPLNQPRAQYKRHPYKRETGNRDDALAQHSGVVILSANGSNLIVRHGAGTSILRGEICALARSDSMDVEEAKNSGRIKSSAWPLYMNRVRRYSRIYMLESRCLSRKR
jgi:hypothetical protein